MIVKTQCPMCKATKVFSLPADKVVQWRNGIHCQVAFPLLSADDRERLISGTCPKCWEMLFGKDTDDDAEQQE